MDTEIEFEQIEELEKKIKQLERDNYLLRKILDQIPSSLYWKTPEGVYLGRNQYALEKAIEQNVELGFTRDSIVGKTNYELLPKEIADLFTENDRLVLQSREEFLMEETFTKNGKEYFNLSSKKPLYDDFGNVIALLGITTDITAEKEAAKLRIQKEEAEMLVQAEKNLREITRILASSIAHDLRTPLATLLTIASVLEEHIKKTDQTNLSLKEAEQIKNIVREMSGFINVTLKSMGKNFVNRIEHNDFVECSIEKCVRKAIHSYPFDYHEFASVHYQDVGDFHFMGDEILVIRVLLNLIKNAIEQIRQQGKGEIFFSTSIEDDYNALFIKDTAGGVSENALPKFEHNYTTKKDGTGVGLAFCKIFMESIGGSISCHLVENDCIEFKLKFPR